MEFILYGLAVVLAVLAWKSCRFNTRVGRSIKLRKEHLASLDASLLAEYRKQAAQYHKEVHAWNEAARLIGGTRQCT